MVDFNDLIRDGRQEEALTAFDNARIVSDGKATPRFNAQICGKSGKSGESQPATDSGSSELREKRKKGWPHGLKEDALIGVAGDVVRAIEPITEADQAAILFQFLAAFGNMCNRRAHAFAGHVEHPPQIWPVTIGETSRARKGTSWAALRQILGSVDDGTWLKKCVVSGLSSGEGLLWAIRDPAEGQDSNESGVPDKRVYVQEAEFATALKQFDRKGNTLSATLRDLFDKGDARSLTKNSPLRVTGAMVTIAPHVTLDELRRLLSETEMANGLANRFLFVCVRRSKKLPFGAELDSDEADKLARRINLAVQEATGRSDHERKQLWTEAAKGVWTKFYEDEALEKPGLLGAVTARAEAQTLRLALIYALLDQSKFFEEKHIRAAVAAWEYCSQSARCIFGDVTGNSTADKIMDKLRDSVDGLTRAQINDLFGGHKAKEDLESALKYLENLRMVTLEKQLTAGRSRETWRVT